MTPDKIIVNNAMKAADFILLRYVGAESIESMTNSQKQLLKNFSVKLPISRGTAHSWLIESGCKFRRHKKSYYTDGHNREDVEKDRST